LFVEPIVSPAIGSLTNIKSDTWDV